MFGLSIHSRPATITVAQDFQSFGLNIRSFREPLHLAVKGIAAPSIRHNFDVGGRPAWKPLKETTVRKKKRNKNKVLVETGKLRRSAGFLNAWDITSSSATYDVQNLSGVDYGGFHEMGTRNMPARPFAVLQDDDAREIEQVFESWLRRRAQAKNFR